MMYRLGTSTTLAATVAAFSLAAFAASVKDAMRVPTNGAGQSNPLLSAVMRPVLSKPLAGSSESIAMTALVDADIAANEAWRAIETPEAFAARQKDMRKAFLSAIGGLPARSGMRAEISGTLNGEDGVRVEKVFFESQPGFFVSANVYLPSAEVFRPPYPAIIVPCGHSDSGKAHAGYQYAGMFGARAGFLTMVYDPPDQGERMEEDKRLSWRGHNWTGALADRLGWSFARIRVWDAMRALDYLETRRDVDKERLCVCGISGGGTVTSLVMALDDRVKAAAPACFLSTIHDTFDQRFPSDSEQEHYGQLTFGLNHLGYLLLRAPSPVLVCCTQNDFFPYKGTADTFSALQAVARRFGWQDRFARVVGLCGHNWPEGNRQATINWFRKWVNGENDAFKYDVSSYGRENVGLDLESKSYRFVHKEIAKYRSETELQAAPGGKVTNIPGARGIGDILRVELDRLDAMRGDLRPDAEKVAKIAGIRLQGRPACEVFCLGKENVGEIAVERLVFFTPDGSQTPAVLLVPRVVAQSPVIVCGDGARAMRMPIATESLASGSPVLLPDLCGWGEIGSFKRKFSGQAVADETLAMTWYPLGRSLVGIRAENIIDCAEYVGKRFSALPHLVAKGRAVIPAIHARFVSPSLFGGEIKTIDPPPSWREEVRSMAKANFADSVHGALALYDWPDLQH